MVLILLGLLILYSASYQKQINTGKNFVLNQIVWIISGASLVFLIASTSYRYFLSVAYIIYGIHIFFLLLVLIIGKTALGAQRWISFGGIGFQPSEFSKVFTILVLARMIGDYPQRLTYIKGLVAPFCIVMLPMILIFKQPDLGTALVFFPIFLAIIWVGGIRLKYLMAMFASVIITMPLFWGLLKEYQKDRLLVFMNPNLDPLGAGYTINQSRIAIGSGMFFGKGWLTGTQNRLNFLPERHTDFIFSVIGEEWGFVGTATILFLFIFFMFRSIRIAESCGDVSGRLICVGITTMLSLHVIINIGMTLGVMPVVGMPLPFISYGGSAFIVNLIAVGFLLNVQNHKSCF
ncbi:MAG: rod shape-determining protein RodA [Candidatus Omnitrophica bacterium]|nr:rod shape-determining protein RodA [Candidatus Omnitrophota bacterium]